MLSKEQYALICFLILMDGYGTKDIRYMEEKTPMLKEGLNAFAWLDYINMLKVLAYLKHWRYSIPEIWQTEYSNQINAAKEIGLEL